MDYTWSGATTAEQAQDVGFLARWAFGRALSAAVRRPEVSVSGEFDGEAWKTVVTWSPRDLSSIIVTFDGFASLDDARDKAREAVGHVVAALVPPNDQDARRERLNQLRLGAAEGWAEGLFRMAAQYP